MKEITTGQIQNILVSRLRFMGDVILTTPLLSALRATFPDAHLGYLVETPYDELLWEHPDVDRIYALNRRDNKSQISLIRAMRQRRWDVSIDLFGNPRSALLLFLSGARYRIGGDFRGRNIFYTHLIGDPGKRMTTIDFHLRYLLPLQITSWHSRPFITVTDAERAQMRDYLAGMGMNPEQALVGIHPGATWPAKRWYPDRFAELADRLQREEGVQILFTMGPGEETLLKDVFKHTKGKFIFPEILSIRRLAAMLSILDVYISNDCGPLHLAPAVGTRTVGIFGPGEPDIWFPYKASDGHRLVYHTLDCSMCHRDLCEKMDCMKAITVNDVIASVRSALAF